VVVVDFAEASSAKKSLFGRFLHRHGRVEPRELLAALGEGGLRVTESGALGIRDFHFAIAAAT